MAANPEIVVVQHEAKRKIIINKTNQVIGFILILLSIISPLLIINGLNPNVII